MDASFEGGSTVLPNEAEDQLALGIRMVQSAFSTKVHRLEQELNGLRLNCDEIKSQASSLQRKNSSLEVELVESHQRSQQLAEENKELFKTVSQLRKQLARLEGLKKRVVDSISDHGTASPEEETWRASALMEPSGYGGSRPSSRPLSPRYGATGPSPLTAHVPSTAPTSYAPAPAVATPSPAVQEPTAAHGNAEAGPMDGKQFFRQARNHLSYAAFNEFLANIKKLNNQQQTREETLEQARRIFGTELSHLYVEFEKLLNRHSL